MNVGSLPSLPKTSRLYLNALFVMVIGFYALLLASLVVVGIALYELIIWTPDYLEHMRGAGAFKLLAILYIAVLVFGWAIIKGLVARVGGDPPGIKADRTRHPRVFALIDDVAARVQADPIHEIFLTAEDELGVWEEAALYLPPGTGKRKIVLGMGALNYLTLDQLRSILAHEFGHFSNRDTFFSRFIYRVSHSYAALMRELRGSNIHSFNPLYWLLRFYTWVYEWIAAAFSRNREFYADRFAVEAYGAEPFAQALITSHIEGSFFNEVGVKNLVELAAEGKGFKNLYHFVGVSRHEFDKENAERIPQILAEMLAVKTGAFDSHPSLRDRLQAQGVFPDAIAPAAPPRPVTDPELDAQMETDALTVAPNSVPSAAEELFGTETAKMQAELSDLAAGKYIYLIERMRAAQAQQ